MDAGAALRSRQHVKQIAVPEGDWHGLTAKSLQRTAPATATEFRCQSEYETKVQLLPVTARRQHSVIEWLPSLLFIVIV